MPEYPKPLFLEGWGIKGSLCGVADTWYRADSPEDEENIKRWHQQKIEQAKKDVAELLRNA